MLLIVAALEEELESAMALCGAAGKLRGTSLRQAERKGKTICFLRSGVGPKRSAARLEDALKVIAPERILVIGYAGAVDPGLKLGDLVAVARAHAFSLDRDNPDWGHGVLDGTYDLEDAAALADCAQSAGLNACIGDALTSPYVLGDPEHKRLLRKTFHASIVDMETAALAKVAVAAKIPTCCIRSVSDEADDTFLAPFSHDPAVDMPARAKKLFDAGLTETYRAWKDHAAVARKSLQRFLACYL